MALEPMANRPWFTLYDPSEDRYLARQIWSGKDEEQDQQLLLPFEMWLAIALQLSTFDGPSRLGQVCRCLRPICRHPELWERRSRAAFSARGFLPSDALLRSYQWSWRKMFMERRRLRFDGMYYISTTRMLSGTIEGRGMKEADKDFYCPGGHCYHPLVSRPHPHPQPLTLTPHPSPLTLSPPPGGMKVTYHRIFRFWPSGDLFVYLTGQVQPESVTFRRAAQAVTPARKASLSRLKGAAWGRFELHEEEGGEGGEGATSIEARVPQYNADFPHMLPATIQYALALRGPTWPCPTNCELALLEHSVLGGLPEDPATTALEVPQPTCSFVPFAGHVIVKRAEACVLPAMRLGRRHMQLPAP